MKNFTIIKDKEFAVLCVLAGIHYFYGSLDITHYQMDKQAVYNVMYDLCRKQLLVYKKEGFSLIPELNTLFRQLKAADRMISFVNPESSENQCFYCCNGQEECVNLQKRWEDADSIRIRQIPITEMMEICKKEELVPEKLGRVLTKLPLEEKSPGIVYQECLEIKSHDLKAHKVAAQIRVRVEGLYKVLIYETQEAIYKEAYTQERLRDFVQTLV